MEFAVKDCFQSCYFKHKGPHRPHLHNVDPQIDLQQMKKKTFKNYTKDVGIFKGGKGSKIGQKSRNSMTASLAVQLTFQESGEIMSQKRVNFIHTSTQIFVFKMEERSFSKIYNKGQTISKANDGLLNSPKKLSGVHFVGFFM